MIALLSVALAASLNCQMDRQIVVNAIPGADWGVGNDMIAADELPNWKFQLTREPGNKFKVTSATDAMNIVGTWQAVELAPGQFAFASAASNCTFTEKMCSALIQVSESGVQTAFVSVTVSGSVKVEGRDLRDHFQLMVLGKCDAQAGKAKS